MVSEAESIMGLYHTNIKVRSIESLVLFKNESQFAWLWDCFTL